MPRDVSLSDSKCLNGGHEWVNRQKHKPLITGLNQPNPVLFVVSKDIHMYILADVITLCIKDYAKSEIDISLLKCSCITREKSDVKLFKLTVCSKLCDVKLD